MRSKPEKDSMMGLSGRKYAALAAGLLLIAFFLFKPGHFDSDLAAKVILAEAADQGLKGMIAVGEVIRNRGELKGFSVLDNDLDKFAKEQPEEIRFQAKLAWFVSRFTNVTKGADHFDNVKRFGMPEWAKDMERTAKIKDMWYFKSSP